MGIRHAVGPFSHGLIDGILQGHGTGSYGMYLDSEEFHTIDIQRLPVSIFFSHKNFAFHTEECCCRSGSHTMLSGTGLCDQTGLTHLFCQQCLSQGIVDLVGAGVV